MSNLERLNREKARMERALFEVQQLRLPAGADRIKDRLFGVMAGEYEISADFWEDFLRDMRKDELPREIEYTADGKKVGI